MLGDAFGCFFAAEDLGACWRFCESDEAVEWHDVGFELGDVGLVGCFALSLASHASAAALHSAAVVGAAMRALVCSTTKSSTAFSIMRIPPFVILSGYIVP